MIDFYTSATPNGHKISILLEETGLPYTVHALNLSAGDQKKPAFLAINPNGKIPAIVDTDTGAKVFESGAILEYVADKAGKFLPKDGAARYAVLQWIMFQMSGVGPTFGQLNHFKNVAPEKIPYAIKRFDDEANRLLGVMDTQLTQTPYIAGDYSIADMALWPWVNLHAKLGLDLNAHPRVKRWHAQVGNRPAVQKGVAIPAPANAAPAPKPDGAACDITKKGQGGCG